MIFNKTMTTQERERLEEIIREWRDHAAKILEDTKDLDWNSSVRIGLRDASFQQLSCADHLELTLSELGDGWISVEERLPEEGIGVVFCSSYYGVDKGHWAGNHWRDSKGSVRGVTHWQPLPKASQKP